MLPNVAKCCQMLQKVAKKQLGYVSFKILKLGTETESRRLENVPEQNQNRIAVSVNSWFR